MDRSIVLVALVVVGLVLCLAAAYPDPVRAQIVASNGVVLEAGLVTEFRALVALPAAGTPTGLPRRVYLPIITKGLQQSPTPPTATYTPTATWTPTKSPTRAPTATWTPTKSPTPPASPQDGHWTGTTNLSYPVSFDISQTGTWWTNFSLKTRLSNPYCSFDITLNLQAPGGPVSSNRFSGSDGNGYAFTGQFTSPNSATGTYAFVNWYDSYCGYFTQSGTWTASK